ncbi:hypothetical protein Tco_1567151 [Tanacetum coccineum]
MKSQLKQKDVVDVTQEEEDNWMIPIQEFLQLGKLPDDPQKARKLRIKAPLYKLIDGTMYRRSYLSPWLRCVGAAQAKNIIKENSNSYLRDILGDILGKDMYYPFTCFVKPSRVSLVYKRNPTA